MNALEIANLLFLLIQTGQLNPEAVLVIVSEDTEPYWISSNQMLISIRS